MSDDGCPQQIAGNSGHPGPQAAAPSWPARRIGKIVFPGVSARHRPFSMALVGYDPSDPIAVSYAVPIGDEPTGMDHPELLKIRPSHGHDNMIINGISRIGFMTGGTAARRVDEDVADMRASKAVGFIESHRGEAFFLYFARTIFTFR